MAELGQNHPCGSLVGHHNFIDSSQSARIEWQFDEWADAGNQERRSQPYGVVIFLKNKANQLDSLKTILEKQYRKSLKPMTIYSPKGEFMHFDPQIYRCEITEGTSLILTKAARYRGDSWSQYNSLRISIGYNLNRQEEELFAVTGRGIHEEID
ncbi:hypothetical protein GCM10028805_58310 [Spirosoma harenae]